jgi:DNA helicase-2/ATP-dependent DNA helicase PcrA
MQMSHSSAVDALVASLNAAQREAVTAPPEHRLVLAGAGSGKTRVLTHRIAWLVAVENISPHSILAVTFTNKAAAEMRGRIEHLLNVPIRAMWVGTFHGIAHRLLRLHWKEARLPQNFQILDADDQLRLVKRVLRGLDMNEEQWPPKQVAAFINSHKEEGRRPHQLQDQGDFSQRQLVRAYTAYQAQCDSAGLVDFAELLLRAYELCRDNPVIQAHYRQRFRHILVDEFQDTNTLQYAWLRVLAGDSGILFAVGDDDQCLAAGTPVLLADGRTKPIEGVRRGERVLSAFGSGRFAPAEVTERIRLGRRGPLIELRTRQGRTLRSTPEHTHLAGYLLGETPQTYFCYLMHKRGVGYRVGTSQVYTRGQTRPMLGFKQRCLHEHADALWVLGAYESENDARAAEMLLSLRYGLPTLPFVPRKGRARNGLVHDAARITHVFQSLDTESSAHRLLTDLGLDPDAPHHRPQSRNANRRNVVVTLCGDRRGATPMHRISIVGNDEAGRAALLCLGLSVRPAGNRSTSWRFETCRKDFGELMAIAERACRALDGNLLLQANLHGRSLPFVKAAGVRAGMAVITADGSVDIVDSVTTVDGPCEVYDLNIDATHNFIAGGIVTLNSVYSWRGARVENMMRLSKDFPGCEVVRLEQNYRSTGTILKAANGLIAKNSARLGKSLWTSDGEGTPIQLYAAFNEYDEAEFIVNRMKEHLDGRCRYSDLAVLYRSNAQSRVLEEALIRSRIPYRIYGGLRFFERMEVKDALAYLRLLANRDDDTSFERAVNTPARGIGATTVERLRLLAREQSMSLWKAARSSGTALGRSAGNLKVFLDLIDTLGRELAGQPLSKVMDVTIARSGLREHYMKGDSRNGRGSEQAEARLENLDELVNAARSFENPFGRTEGEEELDPLNAFLAHAALEAGEQQAGEGEDSVQLMTLHAAKGLEFPIVFMAGMENGLFPHQRAVQEGNLEEERRLCYVGITRAQKQLYLSYAEVRRVHGVEQIGNPSLFLREIPADCVVETRPRAGVLRPAFSGSVPAYNRSGGSGSGSGRGPGYGSREASPRYGSHGPPRPAQPALTTREGPGGFSLGSRVRHARFGEGTILAFDGDGDRTRVEIRFREAGTKWLMLSYAQLEAL